MGRNKSEARAGLESSNADADPPVIWGRPHVWGSIDTRTHAIRRGSGYGTSERWFAVTGGDPSRTRVAASTSHQAVVTAGVGRGNRSVDAG